MLDLRQVRYFVAVAEAGSFTRASFALSTAQPALSRQIQKLERSMGVALLYRHGRGVRLTAEGDKLLLNIKPILSQLEQLEQEIMKDRNAVRGEVTLGMPPSVSGVLGRPLLREFRTAFPEASLRIIDGFSTHIHEWLIAGRLDFAIYYAAPSNPSLSCEPLIVEELYLFGAHKSKVPHSGNNKVTVSFRDLKGIPLALPARHHWLSRRIYREAARKRINLKVDVEIDAVTAIKDMVRRGRVFSIMTYGAIHEEVSAGVFKAYKVVDPVIEHPVVLATSLHHPITNATKEAMQLARRQLNAQVKACRLRGRVFIGRAKT